MNINHILQGVCTALADLFAGNTSNVKKVWSRMKNGIEMNAGAQIYANACVVHLFWADNNLNPRDPIICIRSCTKLANWSVKECSLRHFVFSSLCSPR